MMTPAERLELACLRAWVRAGRWLPPAAFIRYSRLAEKEKFAPQQPESKAPCETPNCNLPLNPPPRPVDPT